ncbi:hypothetical protein BJX65DRAFT_267195 [Aspergillus insuetus]
MLYLRIPHTHRTVYMTWPDLTPVYTSLPSSYHRGPLYVFLKAIFIVPYLLWHILFGVSCCGGYIY